jgi:hypothetical protein
MRAEWLGNMALLGHARQHGLKEALSTQLTKALEQHIQTLTNRLVADQVPLGSGQWGSRMVPQSSVLSGPVNSVSSLSELAPVPVQGLLSPASDIRTDRSFESDIASFYPTESNASSLLATGSDGMTHPNRATRGAGSASGMQGSLPPVMPSGVTASTYSARITPTHPFDTSVWTNAETINLEGVNSLSSTFKTIAAQPKWN